jgi:hypothetical protein
MCQVEGGETGGFALDADDKIGLHSKFEGMEFPVTTA